MLGISDKRLVSTLKTLIAMPSHESQDRIRSYVLGQLRAAGLAPRVDAKGNVICVVGSGKRSLLLNAHMDTVPPGDGWATDPFRAVEKGGRIYGRGASDCKGNVAALLELARCYAAKPPAGKLYITFTGREEYGGLGSRELARRIRADAALVCEGELDAGERLVKIYNGCRGSSNFRLAFRGKAVHSGRASHGVNAVTMCSDFIQKVKKTRLLGMSELIPLMVCGGQEVNVVPDRCELFVNYRLDPNESEAHARATLRALAKGFDCDVREEFLRRGYAGPARSRLISAARRSAASLGYKSEVKICGGTLDSGEFQLVGGIESICTGVGNPHQAHIPNESLSVVSLIDGTRMLAGIVENFFRR